MKLLETDKGGRLAGVAARSGQRMGELGEIAPRVRPEGCNNSRGHPRALDRMGVAWRMTFAGIEEEMADSIRRNTKKGNGQQKGGQSDCPGIRRKQNGRNDAPEMHNDLWRIGQILA